MKKNTRSGYNYEKCFAGCPFIEYHTVRQPVSELKTTIEVCGRKYPFDSTRFGKVCNYKNIDEAKFYYSKEQHYTFIHSRAIIIN